MLLTAHGRERESIYIRSTHKTLYAFLFSPIHTILPINPTLLDFNKIRTSNEYKS
jgi:hypothetical protein